MIPPERIFPLRSCLALAGVLLAASLNAAVAQDVSDAIDTAAAKGPGRLACQPCTLDFGKIHVGQSKALPVTLRNLGKTRVTISAKDKTAAWISPAGLKLPYTLLPGGRVQFHLVYKPLDARIVNGRFNYHSNAENRILPIAIKAGYTTGGTVTASPASLNFGNVAVGQTATLNQTIRNAGSTAVSIEQVAEAGSGFTLGSISTPLVLAPGHSVTVSVQFDPQKATNYSGSLVILSTATNNRLSVVENGTGTSSTGAASLAPAALAFGNVSVGSSETKTLTLTATGGAITVNSDAISNAEFAVTGLSLPLKLAAGKSVTFQATFAPQTEGAASGTVSLALAGSGSVKSSVKGVGTGAPLHSVNLNWNADASTVAGYNVYRGAKSSGPYSKLTSSVETATDYVDSSVKAGGTYYYEVTAVNEQGVESKPTAPVKAVVP